jgi:hypothetical protein
MKKRKRWTILEVDEKAIILLKKYARQNQIQVGLAISKLIKEVLDDKTD